LPKRIFLALIAQHEIGKICSRTHRS
jgi:hypothetical protein